MKSIMDRFADIRDMGPGDIGGEDLCFLKSLAVLHPKTQDCVVLSAKNGVGKPPYEYSNAVWIQCEDGNGVRWDTMSAGPAARVAINGTQSGQNAYDQDCINNNFRAAVDGQRRAFKNSKGDFAECEACGLRKQSHECDVDHAGGDALMFNALVKAFVDTETERNSSFDASAHFGREVYDEQSVIVQRWAAYHERQAKFQLLCKPCHYIKSGAETSRRCRGAESTKRQKTEGGGGRSGSGSSARERREIIIQTKRKVREHPCAANVATFLQALAARGIESTPQQVYGAASGLKKDWH
jgi:hypothetical protein